MGARRRISFARHPLSQLPQQFRECVIAGGCGLVFRQRGADAMKSS